MRFHNHDRDLERLERRRQQIIDRLTRHRRQVDTHLDEALERVNHEFDKARDQVLGALNDKQEHIITAALQVLDHEGLDSLSLRKLSRLLDMQAPALYWHFKNKELLIDYMAEAILQEGFGNTVEPRAADEAWQDWLVAVCKHLRACMRAHRDGGRVVAGAHLFPAVTLVKIFDAAQESLETAGLEMRRANLIISTAVHFTFGRVIEEQSSPDVDALKDVDMQSLFKQFPHMAKAAAQAMEDLRGGYDEFEDALRLIVGRA